MAIDLSKYQKKTARKNAKSEYPGHHLAFVRTGTKTHKLEEWEVRAYDIIHAMMKQENMTMEQVKYMIYEEVLSEVGDELGI